MRKERLLYKFLLFAALAVPLLMAGCSGSDGANGAPGANGLSTGTISGTVSSSNATALVNPAVTLDPAVPGVTPVVNANGSYTITSVPVGVYTVTFKADNANSVSVQVSVVAGQTATQDEALVGGSIANATTVKAAINGTPTPGGSVTVKLTPSAGTIANVTWSVAAGPIDGSGASAVTVTPAAGDPASATVTLPALTDFINQYINVLKTQRGFTDDDTGQFTSVFTDRDTVMGIDPLDLEAMGAVTLKAAVTLDNGNTLNQTVDLATDLSYMDQAGTQATITTTAGLQNVPVNVPVLLHSQAENSYAWSISVAPATGTSQVTKLMDADQQNAYFTPDVAGEYDVTAPSGRIIKIFAGNWGDPIGHQGAIAGIDANGNPTQCFNCHANTGFADDWNTMYAQWAQTGHAHIFSDRLNAGGYSNRCFQCHTVGYNPNAQNMGFDDANFSSTDNYGNLYATFFPNGKSVANPDNWTNLQSQFPETASLTNIQCENCHGPNGSPLHGNAYTADQAMAAGRKTFSAGVCGQCHGEPTHHPSYQLWQRGAMGMSHANVHVAINEGIQYNKTTGAAEGARPSCAGCHTAQGALAYFDQLQAGNPSTLTQASINNDPDLTDVNGNPVLTPDNVQPQTCQVCHDPHQVGGDVATAQVRIDGSTPVLPAGFKATGLGLGAQCIVCHNSRNGGTGTTDANGNEIVGLHEDNDPYFGTLTKYAEPHEACQGDVVMGRNAYFFHDGEIGQRSPHSFIPNTCVNCHMEELTAPADLAGSGATPANPANHTFSADAPDSGPDWCSKCHGAGFDRSGVQSAVQADLDQLNSAMTTAAMDLALADTTDNPGLAPLGTGDTATFSVNYKGASLTITRANGTVENPTVPLPANTANVTVNGVQDTAGDILAKAAWNYDLINQDISLGVHNPGFATDVLQASIKAVSGI